MSMQTPSLALSLLGSLWNAPLPDKKTNKKKEKTNGLTAEQTVKAKSIGTLIPYQWSQIGKDRCTLEAYNKVVLEMVKLNPGAVFNKLVLQTAMEKSTVC